MKKRAASTRPPATLRSLPVLLASAPAAGHASAAGAATWNNRAGGLWSNPANWTPPDVPDSLGESAVLPALSGAYQVTLDINPAIDALQIDAGDPTLDLNGFSIAAVKLVTNSGTIRNFTGTYDSKRIRNLAGGTLLARADDVVQATGVLWNAGTIVVGPGEHSMLDSPGGLWLQGGGTLVLNATRMADPTGGGLTIDAGTAVRGSGVIEKSVDNLGVVEGDGAVGGVLRIDGLLFNTGTVRVIHGGTVNVNRPLVQNTGGTITSARGGGTFSVMMPREVGGTLNNMRGGGRIVADGGDLMVKCGSWLEGTVERGQGGGAVNIGIATLQNVTVAAGAELGVTGHADLMAAGTALTNNGTVRVSGTVNFGIYNGDYQIYLGGKGVMVLEGGTLGSGTGAILVNRAGQTIQGCGTINPPFINEGTVDLNCGPQPARLPGSFVNRGRLRVLRGNLSIGGTPGAVATNRGTISAAGGAITLEKGATLDNAGGVLAAEGGAVGLGGGSGATVIGGRLEGGVSVQGQKTARPRGALGTPGAGFTFEVRRAATLRDVTLGSAATLVTAARGVTTLGGAKFVNEGTNRILGTLVVPPGTDYVQTGGATLVEGGAISAASELQILGGVLRGNKPLASPALASAPGALRFYARPGAGAAFVLELPQAADVDGRVYDAAGREVARIAEGAREAGAYRFALGRSSGAGLPNGVYFGRMVVTNVGVREVLRSRIAVIN